MYFLYSKLPSMSNTHMHFTLPIMQSCMIANSGYFQLRFLLSPLPPLIEIFSTSAVE